MMTYEQLLDRIISDGIAEVREAYADPKDHHKRDGAIEGFEACRGKTPIEIAALWVETERQSHTYLREASDTEGYWRQRYKALQLEWACNVISVGLVQQGSGPLLGWLPTARGALKFAEIVGVRSHGGVA
jgi:hypothetical protein